jgi:hypothetical protein
MANRKPYRGGTIEKLGKALGNYFRQDSPEYGSVMAEWNHWLSWEPGRRRARKDGEGNTIVPEQPEYRNGFSISMQNGDGDIFFRKEIVFGGETKKAWNERKGGIIKNITGYRLTL